CAAAAVVATLSLHDALPILPDGSGVPTQIVAENTQITQQVPFGDKELEFQVRLPSSWVMSEFARYGLPEEEDYSILTNIARYFRSEEHTSELQSRENLVCRL